jgi:hypothetical protein
MKNKQTHLAALACVSLIASAAVSQAAIIIQENFDYGNGGLNGQTGGSGWSSHSWFQTTTNVSGGVAGGGGDSSARHNFNTSLGTTGTIWVRFDWGNSVAPQENGSYGGLTFYQTQADLDVNERFLIGNTWPGSGHDVWRMTNSGATTILNHSGMKSGLAKLDLAAGTASLWVRATGTTIDVSDTPDATSSGLALTNLGGIRINGSSGNSASQSFDNLIIGTTLLDVNAIPEPSAALLGGLGLLALLRRRR